VASFSPERSQPSTALRHESSFLQVTEANLQFSPITSESSEGYRAGQGKFSEEET
jgi:hypothetical protein